MDSDTDSVDTHYPLTKRQQALCLEGDFHPGLPVNWVTVQLDIDDELNVDTFRSAFTSLTSLYASFTAAVYQSKPGQRYFSQSDISTDRLEFFDFSTVTDTDDECKSWLEQWLDRQIVYGEPLWYAALLKLEGAHYRFYLNMHQLVQDGFGFADFIQKLSESYISQRAGGPKEKLQDEFLHNLQSAVDYENTGQYKDSEAYWQQVCANPPEPANLYNQSNYLKTAKTIRLSKELDAESQTLLREGPVGDSLPTFFTAVTFVFLHRVTLNQELVLAIPDANIASDEHRPFGSAAEVYPLRLSLQPHNTFAEVLNQLSTVMATTREHRGHFVSAKNAGYEVMMNCHARSPQSFAGHSARYEVTTPLNILSQREVDIPNNTWAGREGLTIQIHHSGEPGNLNYTVSFDFNSGVWSSEMLRENAISHYCRLLSACLRDPTQKITDIPILTSAEQIALLPEENSARKREETLPLVTELFRQQAKDSPNKTAVVFGNESISYFELVDKVDILSSRLIYLGVKPGVLVGICLDRTPLMIEAMLAVMSAGGAYVPIDPKQPADRIAIILEDAAPLVLLTETSLQEKVSQQFAGTLLCLDEISDQISNEQTARERLLTQVKPDDLAYIIFTSGSTGRPKGVEVYHHGLVTLLQAMAKVPGMDPDGRILSVSTISFDIAALELFLPLIVGGSVCIAPYEMTINGSALAERLNQGDITHFQATPATYRLLLSSHWTGNTKLTLITGGEALPPELAQQLMGRCAALWNQYGPTEATIYSSVFPVKHTDTNIPIGKAIPGTQLYVLNETQQLMPIGVPGELHIAGDGVARGYYNNAALTAEKFIDNPFSSVENAKMYKTGDIVRMRPDLNLEYIGRIDFQVKIRGFRIELGEIEALLGLHDDVAECVVKPWPNPQGEQAIYAYVRLDSGKVFDVAALRRYLKTKLPDYMVPTAFIPMQSFPLTPNGKVDRKQLPEPATAEVITDESNYAEPRNDFELSMVTVWQALLQQPNLGIHDSFFDLGGDSLMTVTLAEEMEKATGISFDIGDIFTYPTIAELSEIQGQEGLAKASSVVPLQAKGECAPLFCLCGINLYQEFANEIGEKHPVYGIYAAEERAFLEQVLSGRQSAISVENLVQRYYEAIIRHQPEGSYQLAGISFGGLVAIETAKLLQQSGKSVDVVILLDTILPTAITRNLLGKVRYAAKKFINRQKVRLANYTLFQFLATNDGKAELREEAYTAIMEKYEYSNTKYDGKVLLVKAKDKTGFGIGIEIAIDYGWDKLLKQPLLIMENPGDHLGIIKQPDVKSLVAQLKSHLHVESELTHI